MKLFTSLALGLGAFVATTSTVDAAVTDKLCSYSSVAPVGCFPVALCALQVKTGDKTPADSCRLRANPTKLPQQVHLAYAGAAAGTAMSISWTTYDNTADNVVFIGTSADALAKTNVAATSATYYSEGDYTLYQHHATVTGLTPNTKYFYKVGSSSTDATLQSAVSSFTTARAAGDATAFNVLVYGDGGDGTNSVDTIKYVNSLAGQVDFVYHIGDISYADDDYLTAGQSLGFYYEEVWNKWMNSLTPIMSQVPYMVLVGNHEAECHSPNCQLSSYKKDHLGNYTAYNARFKMPSKESAGTLNMWHSFEHGPVHFTSISSETDYTGAPTNQYTLTNKNGNFGNQLAWVEADLKKAAANRANVPWIVVGMHRPIYNVGTADGTGKPTGQPKALQTAFEELFIKYGVDVVLAGHEHSFERQFPIARGSAVTTGVSADKKTYANPQAPVYIVTGAAGNVENHTSKPSNTAAWNVASDYENYGVSTLKVTRSSLEWKFIASSTQKELDSFVITKS
ncbi:hypothetical protein Gpo141_00013205 [Globisporangium polare]